MREKSKKDADGKDIMLPCRAGCGDKFSGPKGRAAHERNWYCKGIITKAKELEAKNATAKES